MPALTETETMLLYLDDNPTDMDAWGLTADTLEESGQQGLADFYRQVSECRSDREFFALLCKADFVLDGEDIRRAAGIIDDPGFRDFVSWIHTDRHITFLGHFDRKEGFVWQVRPLYPQRAAERGEGFQDLGYPPTDAEWIADYGHSYLVLTEKDSWPTVIPGWSLSHYHASEGLIQLTSEGWTYCQHSAADGRTILRLCY